jgi:hypothetical protein
MLNLSYNKYEYSQYCNPIYEIIHTHQYIVPLKTWTLIHYLFSQTIVHCPSKNCCTMVYYLTKKISDIDILFLHINMKFVWNWEKEGGKEIVQRFKLVYGVPTS